MMYLYHMTQTNSEEVRIVEETLRRVYERMLTEKDKHIERLQRELSSYRKKEAEASSIRGYDDGDFDNL